MCPNHLQGHQIVVEVQLSEPYIVEVSHGEGQFLLGQNHLQNHLPKTGCVQNGVNLSLNFKNHRVAHPHHFADSDLVRKLAHVVASQCKVGCLDKEALWDYRGHSNHSRRSRWSSNNGSLP